MPATLADIQRKYGESVYPLYKDQMHEPYMENDNGIGYQGVVMYDEHEDKVQCSECGKWFSHMQSHINRIHKKTPQEYKTEHGLLQSTPLCSKKYSQERSHIFQYALKGKNKIKKGEYSPKSKKTAIMANIRVANNTAQYKNKRNLCDAQIAARLIIVRDMCGYKNISEIRTRDLDKYDVKLMAVIQHRYGTRKNACEKLGLTVTDGKKYTDSELIGILRKHVLFNKTIPKQRDINGISSHTFRTHFGSWVRAKMMAGLDQLLAEIKS